MKPVNPFKDAEDRLLFAKVTDRLLSAEKKDRPAFTDFLDPGRCAAFLNVLEKHCETAPKAFGGFESAERKMIGFDRAGEEISFPIVSVGVACNEKFSKPVTHRDYLGATLSLGLERGKIGDIRIGEAGAVMYVSSDVGAFICENLTNVKRTRVRAELGKAAEGPETSGTEKRINVPSMRLDAVLGAALNLARGKASALIEAERVFVNWKEAKKTRTIAPGDMITVRGHGRVRVDSVEGSTKKDRIVLIVTRF